jgi:multiple sugar transport system substrate-binding protein
MERGQMNAPPLRIALVGGPMYDPLYEALDSFERRTGRRIDIAAKLPHPELNAFVRNAFESHAALDVISTHTKYSPSQAQWLMPLDDVLPAELLKDLLPRPAELSRIQGQLLQVPRNLDVRLLHYRRDVIPAPPRTWDDLIATAASLTRHDDRDPFYGFLFPGRDSGLFGTFYELLVSGGGQLFDAQLRPAFDSDAGRWALNQIVAMHQHHRITPSGLPSWHYDEISASFRAGHAAMVSDWPGSYHLYRDPSTCAVADRVGLALLPAGPAGRRAAYAGCHSFAITRHCRDVDGAAMLIADLTSFHAQLSEARHGAIPCRGSALAAIREESAADGPATTRWRLLAETEQAMIIPPRFASYPGCEDAIWRNVQRAMAGDLSVATALHHAAEEIDAIVTASVPAAEKERV